MVISWPSLRIAALSSHGGKTQPRVLPPSSERSHLAARHPMLECAEAVTKLIAARYVAANLATERIQNLSFLQKGDPLQGFEEACHRELETIHTAVEALAATKSK